MRKYRVASVFVLTTKNVKVFLLVDSYHRVVKFHLDAGNLPKDSNILNEAKCNALDFAKKEIPDDMFHDIEYSECTKQEIFTYLPKTFNSINNEKKSQE